MYAKIVLLMLCARADGLPVPSQNTQQFGLQNKCLPGQLAVVIAGEGRGFRLGMPSPEDFFDRLPAGMRKPAVNVRNEIARARRFAILFHFAPTFSKVIARW